MQEEDLSFIFGLATYASDCSRTALAEERYREMAEKAHQYGDFYTEGGAYALLSNLTKDPERRCFWTQRAADMWSGAGDLSAEDLSAGAYLIILGHRATIQDDFSAAEEYYKQALAILERETDSRGIALYGALGDLARLQGDMKTAEAWYQKCWQKAKDLGNTKTQADASKRLGSLTAAWGDVEEALERYQEALEIYQALQDPYNIADTLSDMGELFIGEGTYDLAKETMIQSIRIAERIGNVQLAAVNYNALGRLSEAQEDFTSAKLWFEKAAEMLEDMGDGEIAAIARHNVEIVTAKAAQRQEEST